MRESVKDDLKLIGLVVGPFAILGSIPVGTKFAVQAHQCKEFSKPKEVNESYAERKALFKHAYKNDLEEFKKDLENMTPEEKKEAMLAQNQYGQDVLMIALLSGNGNNVARYILEDPELSQMIDYTRPDDNGVFAIDIIDARISNKGEPELQVIKREIEQNTEKQLSSAEKDGRGNTFTGFAKGFPSNQNGFDGR